MGGPGSTRWRGRHVRDTVERAIPLAAATVAYRVPDGDAELELRWSLPFLAWQPSVLVHRIGGDVVVRQTGWGAAWEQRLVMSKATNGFGSRWVFWCPGCRRGCVGLTETLYWPIFQGPTFRCRVCHRLAYRSQQVTRPKRR